jgi:hypothetical protein
VEEVEEILAAFEKRSIHALMGGKFGEEGVFLTQHRDDPRHHLRDLPT